VESTAIGWVVGTNAAATLFLTGLIWFVQVVHYPLMANVGVEGFTAYEAAHTRRTGYVVAPVMILEAVTAAALAVRPPQGLAAWQAWAGLALVAVLWFSTALIQVPQHRRLARGFDAAAHARLTSTNWLRVAAWSLRSVLVFLGVQGVY
jgi:hypothetical protein